MKSSIVGRLLCVVAAAALVAGQVATASAAPPTRIRFETGAITARVKGTIPRGRDEALYVLSAREGQHMIVSLAPGAKGLELANAGEVRSPSGAQEGGKGGVIFDKVLAETGDYTIRVARNLMATHGGAAGYTVEIVVY